VINSAAIFKLKPCEDRWINYIKHYDKRSFTPKQFMSLKNITHKDKMWVAFRMIDKASLKLVALAIARSVLVIYEKNYPNDMRVRECLDATELYLKGKISSSFLRKKRDAAYAAAYAAYAYAADAYAADAYAADAYAAYASDAAAAYATYAAADAYAAAAARAKHESLQRTIILKYWR
jgi:hypothetical protein